MTRTEFETKLVKRLSERLDAKVERALKSYDLAAEKLPALLASGLGLEGCAFFLKAEFGETITAAVMNYSVTYINRLANRYDD